MPVSGTEVDMPVSRGRGRCGSERGRAGELGRGQRASEWGGVDMPVSGGRGQRASEWAGLICQ